MHGIAPKNVVEIQCRIKVAQGCKFKKTSKHLLNHEVCGQGIRVSSFTVCMLFPVRIVAWQCECIMLTTSVVRWLWPKYAKWCHKKLLDSVESLVINFQLKSAKSNEILLQNLPFLTWLKEGSVYFTGDILVATDQLELLCRQSKIRSHGMTQYQEKGHFVKKMLSCLWCDGYVLQLLCQWFWVRLWPCWLSFFFSLLFSGSTKVLRLVVSVVKD